MADQTPGLPIRGNALLDMVARRSPFPARFDKEAVRMRKNQRISFENDGHGDIYFPITSLFSLRCSIRSGYTAEFGQIGRDGVVGITSLFGDLPGTSEAIVLAPGFAYRIRSSLVRSLFEESADFRRVILEYMSAQMREAAQRIICTKQHSITEQLSRTLLMASDRLGSLIVDLTHEQLAIAIGCRREAVSIAAGKLQGAGIIQYGYGRISITDRAALENRSCECYSVLHEGYAKFVHVEDAGLSPAPDSRVGHGRKA